jgi:predicted alpha/beta hydrolase
LKTEERSLRCTDGASLPATLVTPGSAPQRVMVVGSAMGVPRRYYKRYAEYLASRGTAVLTFDYRGIADAAKAAPAAGITFQDWGRLDLHAALELAYAEFPGLPVFLTGHSAGAQLAGLTPLGEKLAGFVFVAGPRPGLTVDPLLKRPFTTLWWCVIVPLASRGKWFPARALKFSTMDIPAGVTREWSRWARSRRYLFSPEHGIDTSRYARFRQPILAWSFSDDSYAPPRSTEGLLAEYPNAAVTRRAVRPSEVGAKAIGHMGFFRDTFRDSLWNETASWLEQAGRGERA